MSAVAELDLRHGSSLVGITVLGSRPFCLGVLSSPMSPAILGTETPSPAVAVSGGGVSIVIPVFDEESGIGPVLDEIQAELEAMDLGIPVEVVVVDDGSRDQTVTAVEPYLGGRVRLVSHARNMGYGAALRTGIEAAEHPWVLITDADGTYPFGFWRDLLARRDDHDMVVGARGNRR